MTDDTELIDTLRESFRQRLCENQLDPAAMILDFSPGKHKAINCSYCNTVHLVYVSEWKKFLAEVRGCGASQQVANLFIHCALSGVKMHAHYANLIESTQEWLTVAVPVLEKQSKMGEEFKELLCERSDSIFEAHKQNQASLSLIFCVKHQANHFVVTEDYNVFAGQLELKNSFATTFKGVPRVIYHHVESILDLRAGAFLETLAVKPVKELVPEIVEEYYSEACRTSDAPDFSFNAYHPKRCLRCNRWHTVKRSLYTNTLVKLSGVPGEELAKKAFRKAIAPSKWVTFYETFDATHPMWSVVEEFSDEVAKVEGSIFGNLCANGLEASEGLYPVACQKHGTSHFISSELYEESVVSVDKLAVKYTSLEVADPMDEIILIHFINLRATEFMSKVNSVPETNPFEVSLAESNEFKVSPYAISDELLKRYYICGRKNRYATPIDALVGSYLYISKAGSELYLCEYCSGYHYGSPSKSIHTDQDYADQGFLLYSLEASKWKRKANRFVDSLRQESVLQAYAEVRQDF